MDESLVAPHLEAPLRSPGHSSNPTISSKVRLGNKAITDQMCQDMMKAYENPLVSLNKASDEKPLWISEGELVE